MRETLKKTNLCTRANTLSKTKIDMKETSTKASSTESDNSLLDRKSLYMKNTPGSSKME